MRPAAGHMERPVLTMPEEAAAAVREAYGRASVILEYGSGGSTVLAAEMPGKQVTSVESDRKWARMMRSWFDANPPVAGSQVEIVHADIGPTREWGRPVDDRAWRRFARYPLAVWEEGARPHPDVVLVDGRFRVGCALACAFHITRPVTLLFDDYRDRKWFHQVKEFIGPPARMAGRMAVFDLAPMAIPLGRLSRVIRLMQRP